MINVFFFKKREIEGKRPPVVLFYSFIDFMNDVIRCVEVVVLVVSPS